MTDEDPTPSPSEEERTRAEENERSIALMTRVRDGDTEAFEELVVMHQNAVIGTVVKMLGSPTEAEDIAQQVFLRVWKSASRYEPQAKFTTWLFTITRNLVFNEVRRRRRKPTVSQDEREEDSHRIAADTQASSPDDDLIHTELEAAVDKAIADLPEKQRLAVILRRYEEMPYEDMAKILSLSVPAVKSLLFRARSQLKESLRKYLEP